MPDPAKLQALRDAGFQILPTCGYCRFWHGQHSTGRGSCPQIPYQHGKHTGDERMASTTDNGWCPKYEADREYLEARLAAYMEFFSEENVSEGWPC